MEKGEKRRGRPGHPAASTFEKADVASFVFLMAASARVNPGSRSGNDGYLVPKSPHSVVLDFLAFSINVLLEACEYSTLRPRRAVYRSSQ